MGNELRILPRGVEGLGLHDVAFRVVEIVSRVQCKSLRTARRCSPASPRHPRWGGTSFLLFLLLLVSGRVAAEDLYTAANASSSGFGDVSIGMRTGLSLSQHQGTEPREFEYTVGSEMRNGVTAGLLVVLPITERFYLQQEVNYVRKGSRQDIGVEIFEIPTVLDVDYDLDYIEIPVFLRYNWWMGNRLDVYSLGGFGFAMKINDQYELSGLVDDGTETIPLSAKDDMSEVDLFDFLFAYGVGVEVPWGGQTWMLEYRFDLSLDQLPHPTYAYVPFGEEELLIENEPVPLRNQSHLITVGIRF